MSLADRTRRYVCGLVIGQGATLASRSRSCTRNPAFCGARSRLGCPKAPYPWRGAGENRRSRRRLRGPRLTGRCLSRPRRSWLSRTRMSKGRSCFGTSSASSPSGTRPVVPDRHLVGGRGVVRCHRLTPRNRSESTCCAADRRPICAPNNTIARSRSIRATSGALSDPSAPWSGNLRTAGICHRCSATASGSSSRSRSPGRRSTAAPACRTS